ncbi:major facilitator superfamily domain-containing protein [Stachybotrys elegans]|uniref:Major facilitator superfamily domain-containing protein n=1 Tax=Stachybotrys elegans TaxID=80388 RepID=A0A8K0SVU8_9HYPO|nr:major facilitator superfamily domain-containing protein [Stachybotrys elegans]
MSADTVTPKPRAKYSWRFWAIFLALAITSLLASVESTVVSTALPHISGALDAGENYVWFVNAYFLTGTACLPLFGQMADIFGRRWLTISIVAIFALGSGICGGATSTAMLIGGRAVQGIGGGGINLMIEMIVCDLVPLRDRGRFMGVIFAIFAIGTSLGPFIGGAIVENTSWKWVFYINLPVSGVSLALLAAFLHVNYERGPPTLQRLRRIDYTGNVILISSVTAVLIALSYGGTLYPWSAWQVILPLVLGVAGIAGFYFFETSPWCAEPMTPRRLFSNRTSAAAFFLTFVHAMSSFWIIYFLPVYFQAVLLEAPTRSGVLLLPTVITIVPGGLISGFIMSMFGRYRPLHLVGFAMMTLGISLFVLLDQQSRLAHYVVFQIIAGIGSGLALTTLLPATQAALSEKDTASSTAVWSFVRSFGTVWGVSVPAAIFNSRADSLAYTITDPAIQGAVANGQAYSHASSEFLNTLSLTSREQVVGVFADSLRTVWIVAVVITGLSFFVVFVEKEIALRSDLETEYGLQAAAKPHLPQDVESSGTSKTPRM